MVFLFRYLQIKLFQGCASFNASFTPWQLHSSSGLEDLWKNYFPETNMPDPFMNEKPKATTPKLNSDVFIYNYLFKKIAPTAISVNGVDCKCLILSSTFKECHGTGGGGGIRFSNGDLVISRSFSTSNWAKDKEYGLFAYIAGKKDKSNIKIDQVTTFVDGNTSHIRSPNGGIFIKESLSVHVKNVNQTNNQGNTGVALYIKDSSDIRISFSNFASNFGYSSILEIYSNAIMEYCNLANNFIQNHLINAAIQIFDNEFKISYCNLLHRIDDNMYYQSQPKGKFIVSNCYVLQSNKHVKNGFVNTFNVDSREEKYINFATYFIQEFQAYAENRNKATPLQTPIITPVVTPVGTPVKTNAQTPAGTFFVTPAVTFGVTPAITPAGTPVITPAGTPVITPEKTLLPTEKTPEPSDLPDYLSMNYKHAYRKPIY